MTTSMHRIGLALAIILTWIYTNPIQAEALSLPDLVIKKERNRKPKLEDLEIHVSITGNLAETVLDLNYFNEGKWNAEGEFTLKLPEGATVSTYALEVNGSMRPGVSVRKEQARIAYETIKAQNIDPGLVEREKNNIYRTRIFPIFPRKHKRVRIGFTHPLKDGKYEFPFDKNFTVKTLKISVSGELDKAPILTLNGEIQYTQKETQSNYTWDLQQQTMNLGSLSCQATQPDVDKPTHLFDHDSDGNLYFVSQGKSRATGQPRSNQGWDSLQIIWDASLSAARVDQTHKYQAISKFIQFSEIDRINIHLLRKGSAASEHIRFPKGDPEKVLNFLKKISYFGNADFTQIGSFNGKTLLFTDGEAKLSKWAKESLFEDNEVYLCHYKNDKIHPHLFEAATELLAIDTEGWWQHFLDGKQREITTNIPRKMWNFTSDGNQYLVTGKIPAQWKYRSRMKFGSEDSEIQFRNIKKNQKIDNWNFARRIWAETRLAKLEAQKQEEVITEFAINERLVSDYTSLIVLERFEDHIKYRIPPPEPDLLEKYNRELERLTSKTEARGTDLWVAKKRWHQSSFHWFDFDLRNELRTVGIWTKSARTAFPEGKLNSKPIEAYENWYQKSRDTILNRDKVNSDESFKSWVMAMDQHLESLHQIRKDKPSADKDGEVHVSVRGRTRTRGIFSNKGNFSLMDAIDQAKGVWHPRDLTRVYLYRDAKRIGYNLRSLEYRPVALEWGDMIVVEGKSYDPYTQDGFGFAAGAADPFAPAPAVRRSSGRIPGADEPAVFEESGNFQHTSPNSPQPFGKGTSKPGRAYRGQLSYGKPITGEFFKQLKQHQNPESFLNQSYAEGLGFSEIDLIKAAAILNENDHQQLANSVLNQLFEVIDNPLVAGRIIAYWLMEFGQLEAANQLLNELIQENGSNPGTKALLHFDLAQINQDAAEYQNTAETCLLNDELGSLFTIALTDFYNLKQDLPIKLVPPYKMASDIRVVVTGFEQSYGLQVKTPDKYASLVDHSSIRSANTMGVIEHQTKKGFPGVTQLALIKPDPGTYFIRAIRNFGTDHEQVILKKTLLIEPARSNAPRPVGSIDLSWDNIEVKLPTPKPDPFEDTREPDPFGGRQQDPFGDTSEPDPFGDTSEPDPFGQ